MAGAQFFAGARNPRHSQKDQIGKGFADAQQMHGSALSLTPFDKPAFGFAGC
jgi:hypothetical protein